MVDFDVSVFRREPTLQEAEAALKEIDRQELAISMIERRIHKLLCDIQELRRSQAEHAQTARRCKGVITLARRIPEELLAKIFEHCVACGWSLAPVVVSHVCSAWRKAALSPRVWSHLYVNSESPDVLARTRFWLSMARSSPLHVSILSTWRTNSEQLLNAVTLLNRRASQWQTFSIDSDMLRHADLVASNCLQQVPKLHEISVSTQINFEQDLDGEQERLNLAAAFDAERAPALKELHFTCTAIPTQLTFPSHITVLHLSLRESLPARPLSAVGILNLLDTLSSLEDLTLTMPLFYEHPYISEDNTERTVTFSKLKSVTMYGPTDLNGFIAHLYAPALRRLRLRSLEDTGYRQESVGPTLLEYIHRSSPPLEVLELHDIDLTPEYFAAAFLSLPALHTLCLHESSISDATLSLLESGRRGGGRCPRLTHLDLRWCGQLTGKALVNLVASRAGALPILEVAVLNCCYVQENDVLDIARMTVCRVCLRDDDYCRK
ncbi:hypothetical protein EIP86_007051 [Pleurotus ostreatoroseus]|nr:hypothetical protein EIP86_007051 [Pleurotus ostreatoroseus]